MTAVDQSEMLEVLLSYCATWQALTNATGVPATAATFIHQYEADDDATYPRATIIDEESVSEAVGTNSPFSGRGQIYLRFDLVPDVTLETRKDRRAWVRGKVHTIRSEMEALSYGRTTPSGYSISHLIVKSIRVGPPMEQTQFDEDDDEDCSDQGRIWQTHMNVEYGN